MIQVKRKGNNLDQYLLHLGKPIWEVRRVAKGRCTMPLCKYCGSTCHATQYAYVVRPTKIASISISAHHNSISLSLYHKSYTRKGVPVEVAFTKEAAQARAQHLAAKSERDIKQYLRRVVRENSSGRATVWVWDTALGDWAPADAD